jgi:hypothetical protein
MPDYATLLHDATRRLDELDTFNITRVPQAEGLAPLWFTTAEGMAYLAALQRGADAEALDIWDQAYGDALNAWIDLLWQAPWPATKEDTRWEPI